MLHYKSDVVEPESVAKSAIEGFAAACNEVEYEMGRLRAWFSPSFFLNDNVLAFAVDVVQPKTRPDSPVPSLQGPCDRSLKSEVPCGSCLNWR